MPRDYEKTGGPGGRPTIDDAPIARTALFAFHIEGHDREAVLRWAVAMLKKQRKDSADASAAVSKRDGNIGHDAARRRVNQAVVAELKVQGGNTPLLGLPPSARAAGAALAEITRQDGYAAGRTALLHFLMKVVFGAFADEDCEALIDRWISVAEAEFLTA